MNIEIIKMFAVYISPKLNFFSMTLYRIAKKKKNTFPELGILMPHLMNCMALEEPEKLRKLDKFDEFENITMCKSEQRINSVMER